MHARKSIELGRIAVVADTHGRPHPELDARLHALAPDHVLHAGDVGDASVLDALARRAPVTVVRGNIDALGWPDAVTIDVGSALRILLVHIGQTGAKLRADVLATARRERADMVVCGHSHIPFAGTDRGVTVFNPGSVGPRRFQLPIVFGVIEASAERVAVHHVDCESGARWRP